MRLGLAVFAALSAAAALGAVLDRVAVAVGDDVITETEIAEEIRLTAFLNGENVDLGPASRREAAERLVDQYLIRREMNIGNYPEPEASEAQAMLENFKKTHYGSDAGYRAALARYGITDEQVKQRLLWQLASLRFTDMRFRPDIPRPTEALRSALEQQSAERASKEASRPVPSGRAVPPPAVPPQGDASREGPGNVDEQLDSWLKEARGRTRIVYFKEAFGESRP